MTQDKDIVKKHIKTHSVHSAEDRAAVAILESFLRSNGKINTNFAANDTWPNTDGNFEFVPNPYDSRRPTQNFSVQIKGTHTNNIKNDIFKYSLQSLAFPATIFCRETLDPGILFVILNPDIRGEERVFWKYMSVAYLETIDFNKDSVTISFSPEEEILNTNESVEAFCKSLEEIIEHHLFVNKLSETNYSQIDIEKRIVRCNSLITESIENMEILNMTRDDLSRKILMCLEDLCTATLLLNALSLGYHKANLQLAWESASLNIETKYLASFLKGLRYIDNRVPDDGQSERLMLKYYNFLWQIRHFLYTEYNITVLENLEKFPIKTDKLDSQYYELVAEAVNKIQNKNTGFCASRFYVQKKIPFFIGKERFYEITLQLSGAYATKYNRITVYTKCNISTNYSIQIGYEEININLWDINTPIKVVTNWKVSVDPVCLNKLAKILRIHTSISSNYGEYKELMKFLTHSGMNLLDLIDLKEVDFDKLLSSIYDDSNTSKFKDILLVLRRKYSISCYNEGINSIRYLLLSLREESLIRVMPNQYYSTLLCNDLYLSKRCLPFERNPFISNLAGGKTSESGIARIVNIAGLEAFRTVRPYLSIKESTKKTGEIYFPVDAVASEEAVQDYNDSLDAWERKKGYLINNAEGVVTIDSFEQSTITILDTLLAFSHNSNKGQKELNTKFLKDSGIIFSDNMKKQAIQEAFVNSRVLLIYGAAGTGKTTLINYLSNLMINKKKLFLSKTHTAKQNLMRRIDNPGVLSEFVSIDSFTKKVSLQDYDIIFVDECSTIDNRTLVEFFKKVTPETFLVFAGDIHQIESIDFGNWFYYAKDIIKIPGANVELLNTWRTEDQDLITLWNEVRTKGEMITEKLAMNGPFTTDISKDIFEATADDEVVLCLNYDGKFGLNNINSYFQNKNIGKAVYWNEWCYKEGDRVLFNETARFSLLHNNLKGKIVKIEKGIDSISFTIDIPIPLTEADCKKEEIELIDVSEGSSRIRFNVYEYKDEMSDDEYYRMKTVIPFQLAYAVSIHKSQGLEYDSVKVVIPSANSEKITHGIFYTAITRAKKSLKIYSSSETMDAIIKGFSEEKSGIKSLDIVKKKLKNLY